MGRSATPRDRPTHPPAFPGSPPVPAAPPSEGFRFLPRPGTTSPLPADPPNPPHPHRALSGSSPGTGPYPTPTGGASGHRGSRLRRVRCDHLDQAAGRLQVGAHLARFGAARVTDRRPVGAEQTGSRGTDGRGAVPDPPASSTATTRRGAVVEWAGADDLVATVARPAGAVPGSLSVAAAGSAAGATAAVAPPGAGVAVSLLIIAGSSSRCPRYRLSRPRHQQCGPALGRHLT